MVPGPSLRRRCSIAAVSRRWEYALSGCARVSASPTPKPTPTPSLSPTPGPTPLGLESGQLSYTSNACFTSVKDSQGRVLSGAIIEISTTVTNTPQAMSEPVWLVVDPNGLSTITMSKSPLQPRSVADGDVVFESRTIAAGESATLAASVFFQASFRADYRVYVVVGSEESLPVRIRQWDRAADWGETWTSISVC
jgi:hypothetical protein